MYICIISETHMRYISMHYLPLIWYQLISFMLGGLCWDHAWQPWRDKIHGATYEKVLTSFLIHWGWVTHICVSKLTIIGSDNGLSPSRRQAIIWTNAGILLIRTLGANFSEIFREIHVFWFKKMHLKMSSAKWRPFCLGLNVLNNC